MIVVNNLYLNSSKPAELNGNFGLIKSANKQKHKLNTRNMPKPGSEVYTVNFSFGKPIEYESPEVFNYPNLIFNIASGDYVCDFTKYKFNKTTKFKIEIARRLDSIPRITRVDHRIKTTTKQEPILLFDTNAFPKCISLEVPLMQLPEFPSLRYLKINELENKLLENASLLTGALGRKSLKVKGYNDAVIDVDKLIEAACSTQQPKSARKV
jgi:hypothetical protein